MRRSRAFTLLEIIISVSILMILLLLAIPSLNGVVADKRLRRSYDGLNALVLQANRRLSNGLQFQANYTLSRAEDNGQSSVTFTSNNLPFNAFDQSAEKALSSFGCCAGP